MGLGDEAVDGGLEVDDRTEDAPFQTPPGELGEEGLDGVEPRAGGWGEVEDKHRVSGEPFSDLRVFVCGVVVEDDVNYLAGRHLGLDGIEEANELLMAVALHAAAGDPSLQHVERGEQRGGAMALVIMGHGASPAALHRQAGLGAVKGLDLAFLVDRENHGVGRRIDVETDDVLKLGGEGRVLRQLELAHPMRLQAVGAPDTLNRADADPGCLGHRRRRPVGRLAGRVARRQFNHARDQRPVQRRLARGSGLVGSRPSTPARIKRSCQRQTTDLLLPVRRMISAVPRPSAVSRIIRTRQTCFCGLFQLATIAASRKRSSPLTFTTIPLRMPQTRTRANHREYLNGLVR